MIDTVYLNPVNAFQGELFWPIVGSKPSYSNYLLC